MESVLVNEFIDQTGCETTDVAYHYLQTCNWNVPDAVQAFRDALNGDFAESSKFYHFLVRPCNVYVIKTLCFSGQSGKLKGS